MIISHHDEDNNSSIKTRELDDTESPFIAIDRSGSDEVV